jgi:hypothetical protein
LSSGISLQADTRVLLYRLALTDPEGADYGPATQWDLLAHLGVVIHLGKGDEY